MLEGRDKLANISKSKQLLVRTALVAGSSVAALIGAQTLAMTDLHKAVVNVQQPVTAQTVDTNLKSSVLATVQQPNTVQTIDTSVKTTTTITIGHIAPNLVILSGDNEQPVNSELTSRVSAAIVPPVPQANPVTTIVIQATPQPSQPIQQYNPPAPAPVQQFPVVTTHSSR